MKNMLLYTIVTVFLMSSCTMVSHSIVTPEINLSDLDISDEVWGQAKSVKILGLDYNRMFKRKIETATIGMGTTGIPIITSKFNPKTSGQSAGLTIIDTENLALQDLLNKNKEYDILIAPKFSKTIEGFWPLYWTETVMVKARIGKIK
ncbi:MAG: hypothetical protein CM1200mP10_25620 [Candidatus Neomarinimicrobiota bacterium]|nr:MAG: hypothetical protein CM1200mP10_25620 [Candidatus Neomarinimicrobiota bacterium]